MNISTLTNKIRTQLGSILTENGSIVFSSVKTISKGDLYTLGLNPGGEADIPLERIISELPAKMKNSYTQEEWENKKKKYCMGEHPLQKNFIGLIKAIGYDPSNVFSSNLIFSRSRNQYGANFRKNADICWPVHKEFLKLVDPKFLIVFGNSDISPFQYILDNYQLKKMDIIPSGHGKWKCYWYKGIIEGKERHLIGMPHLSRYYITYHREVISWVKKIIIDFKET
jgi:hypothetical protein